MIIYTVSAGDTVTSIANSFGVPPKLIVSDNEIAEDRNLAVGEALVIRTPSLLYTVQPGDTLSSIARSNSLSLLRLYQLNPSLGGLESITPGQLLVLTDDTTPVGDIITNGYLYPNIDTATLRRTLPYLSYMTVFTYGINRDGTLIPPIDESGEAEIIALAREYRTRPLMMLSTLTSEGTFSNELAAYVFENSDIQSAIIENVVNTVVSRGYSGVDLDFEYIDGQYADDYAAFTRSMREALEAAGDYVVFVALAPKNRRDQPGLLYEGHDYRALADAATYALLMTYEWGYTYGPPMAVAPINEVRRVVDYAMTEMPSEKALLGIPNYGYDWTLPFIRGESRAQSLSNLAAVERAAEVGAEIVFDPISQAPYYFYSSSDASGTVSEHVVWFEDARSVTARGDLIDEYQLAGGSVWNIQRYFPQLWLVLDSMYNIAKY